MIWIDLPKPCEIWRAWKRHTPLPTQKLRSIKTNLAGECAHVNSAPCIQTFWRQMVIIIISWVRFGWSNTACQWARNVCSSLRENNFKLTTKFIELEGWSSQQNLCMFYHVDKIIHLCPTASILTNSQQSQPPTGNSSKVPLKPTTFWSGHRTTTQLCAIVTKIFQEFGGRELNISVPLCGRSCAFHIKLGHLPTPHAAIAHPIQPLLRIQTKFTQKWTSPCEWRGTNIRVY